MEKNEMCFSVITYSFAASRLPRYQNTQHAAVISAHTPIMTPNTISAVEIACCQAGVTITTRVEELTPFTMQLFTRV